MKGHGSGLGWSHRESPETAALNASCRWNVAPLPAHSLPEARQGVKGRGSR